MPAFLRIVMANTPYGHLYLINGEIFDLQQFLDLFIGGSEMNDAFTVSTQGVVVRVWLMFIQCLTRAEMKLFNEFFLGEKLEISVDGGQVNVGELLVYLACGKGVSRHFQAV